MRLMRATSGFSDGRSETSPVSEDIEPAIPQGIKAKLSEHKENPRQDNGSEQSLVFNKLIQLKGAF